MPKKKRRTAADTKIYELEQQLHDAPNEIKRLNEECAALQLRYDQSLKIAAGEIRELKLHFEIFRTAVNKVKSALYTVINMSNPGPQNYDVNHAIMIGEMRGVIITHLGNWPQDEDALMGYSNTDNGHKYPFWRNNA